MTLMTNVLLLLHGLEAHSKTSAWNHGMGFSAPGTLAVMCEHILNIPIPYPEFQSQNTSSASWRLRPHHLGFATMCFYLMFLGFPKGHAFSVE